MRRLIAGGAVGALAATLLTVGGVSPAVAATGDGTISVTVVQDTNVNKRHDPADVPLDNVEVRITDAAGDSLTVRTDATGVATLAAAENTLAGGRYRVEVTNPNVFRFSEAQVADDHADAASLDPAVSFVDVRDGADANVAVGYVDYSTLGVDGARIFSAVQPDDAGAGGTGTGVYNVKYDLSGGVNALTDRSELGAVYGIGIDTETAELYVGAYAKRGSLYGPAGAGGIYRVNSATGAWETYAVVADAGDTEHVMEPAGSPYVQQDYAFRTAVGRESLGDVEVSEDNKFLTTVNLNTKSLVVFPVQEALDPAPIQTLAVAAPEDCVSDWQPMGLAERGSSLFVGAVCGSDLRAFVLEYERAADGTLGSSPVKTMSGDVTETTPRAGEAGPGIGFGLHLHVDCVPVDWRVWTDEVPQACVDNGRTVPSTAPGVQFVVPQPMLGDIEFLEDGRMVLSFRDRGGDQYGLALYIGQKSTDVPSYAALVATGDIVTIPSGATSLDFATATNNFDDNGGGHNQAAYSGITHVSGSDTIVGNMVDANNTWGTNGLRAWDAETGEYRGGNIVTVDFSKGMGLADVESLVLEQSQQIGNRIWSDLNQDGIQNPNEGGIAGVQVSLYDADGEVIATTETDANGEYWFDTADGVLPRTSYEVRLDRAADFEAGGPLAGYTPTEANRGFNRGVDSNGEVNDAGVVIADVTTPAAGINDHSIDFGFVPTLVSVGDYVWFDADRDGIQDSGETPIEGVEVIIFDRNGVEVARTTTDANGFYAFGDLVASSEYTIEFPTTVEVDGEQVPLTRANQGSDDGQDSDADPATGRVTFTTTADGDNSILPGEVDLPTIDAGYTKPILVSMGTYVWFDANSNGVRDAGEAPIAGIEVILYDANGVEVARTTTDSNGFYAFGDLVAGAEYSVQFPTTAEVDGKQIPLTRPGQGTDGTKDSNADPETGRATFTAPADGENSTLPGEVDLPGVDAGYAVPVTDTPVSVGDYLWIDADRDGIQDSGENPVAGAEVILYDAEGVEVARTTTDSNGFYAFGDLDASTEYSIAFPTTVTVGGAEYPLTRPRAGSDRGADSNPGADGRYTFTSPATGDNSTAPGEADDPTIDAGYAPLPTEELVSIGDYLWLDADRDGVQDSGEKPVAGAEVILYDAEGVEVARTTTDEDGYYAFPDLTPGADYSIQFPTTVTVGGKEYPLTKPGAGSDRGADSNPGADGKFAFTAPTSGDNSTAPGEADDPTIDAGYAPPVPAQPVSVGDYVWIDADRDGIQDAGEKPVPGVEVTLYDADGVEVARTTTDENGFYVFPDLTPDADYSIGFPTTVEVNGTTVPLTSANQGGDDAKDSDADPTTGRVEFRTPASGENSTAPGEADLPTIDAGYAPAVAPVPVSVGDYVWVDADRDGIQDKGEKPLPGVEVKLFDADGNLVGTTKTDEDGYYVFTDLTPGAEYTVQFPTTVTVGGVEYPLTTPGAGSDRGADSNPGADGKYTFNAPTSGDNSAEPGQADDPTIDAGYVIPSVSVGDFVWLDTDRDGVQDAGEPGIPGVTLTLTGPDGKPVTDVFGNPVGPVTTDKDGKYSFENLPVLAPGQEYTVTVTPPAGYLPTLPGVGEPGTDSSTGSASSGDLTTDGARDDTLDFGFYPNLVSIGDYVWLDADGDGVQDPGEKPLPGVEVKLFDKDGNLVATTTTDENGFYVFTDLKPGTDYFLEFPTTVTVDGVEHFLTRPGQGTDGTDSNADPATGRVPVTTPKTGNNSALPGEVDDPTYDVGYALIPVVTPTPTPTPSALPSTGLGDMTPLAGLAALLLLAGAGAFIARRRTSQQ
ncbi:SdrD B-like domain-containing protein [Microbacterium gorillae]|uniref:SdrD B-like domain-containing protein n=1 Tax=Microbacterium gorillae TaxID=1231063 RepID=UPI003D986BDB